jgi:HAD superfamily hydrolase (TIGR01509 family)
MLPRAVGMLGERTTIICDLSEVLIPGLIGVERALARATGLDHAAISAALGIHPFYEVGNHLDQLFTGAITYEGFMSLALGRLGLDGAHRELVHGVIIGQFEKAYDYTPELIDHLRARATTLVLFSDHCPPWVSHIRSSHPFLARFDRQIFSYDLGSTKRDARSFPCALGLIGRRPGECVFIDDNARNVAHARAFGIHSILFAGAQTARAIIDDAAAP